jgi:ABC-2 type transport system ATP-binding protein
MVQSTSESDLSTLRNRFKKQSMSEKKEIAIKVEGVYKDFDLPHEVNNNLKQKILHPFKRTTTEKQHALKDISFEIEKGDFFGIVGRNGSGKSTLLKIIAQIYTPTKGKVTVNGSLTPFIELGVGFNPELTGRENVFLNGAMLGFSKKEMAEMYDEIVEFAELEKFMDQKLKNYSSGMQVRLAFSVAIRAKSDILLLDEVLAVGDINFQKKCLNFFRKLKEEGKTVILVSHNVNTVKEYCDKGILLEESNLVKTKNIDEALSRYLEIMKISEVTNQNKTDSLHKKAHKTEVINCKVHTDRKKILISYSIKFNIKDKHINHWFNISDSLGNKLTGYKTNFTNCRDQQVNKGQILEYIWEMDSFLKNGHYILNIGIVNNSLTIRETKEDVIRFTVTHSDRDSVYPVYPNIKLKN